MTTASITNLTKGLSQPAMGVKGQDDIRTRKDEAEAAMFGSLMNQYGGLNQWTPMQKPKADFQAGGTSAKGTEYSDLAHSNVNIPDAKPVSVENRVETAGETVSEVEDRIVQTVSEQLEVSEEEVEQVMAELGITAFDLLIPQNLGKLVMEITEASEPMQLLVNPQMQELLGELGELGEELMQQLQLGNEQVGEFVAYMDAKQMPQEELVTQPVVEMPESEEVSFVPVQEAAAQPATVMETEQAPLQVQPADQHTSEPKETVDVTQEDFPTEQMQDNPQMAEQPQMTGTETVAVRRASVSDEQEVIPAQVTLESAPQMQSGKALEETADAELAEEEPLQSIPVTENAEFSGGEQEETPTGERQEARPIQREHVANEPVDRNLFHIVGQEPVTSEPVEIPQAEMSYASADTVELISQIVENVRSAVQNQVTSFEMLLNPEHLGKVFVHLTAREGAVNAQFMAANESVRAALETQVAQLRENLNQAGVKVDAIEIAVGTHEFEQNLEQNAQREAEQAAQQEQERQRQGRRNLSLDSLDELSGLMTEEERLVAQIMQDNGNSMDVTA